MGVSDQPPLHAEPSAAATAAAGVTSRSSSSFCDDDFFETRSKRSKRSAARRAADATVAKCVSSPSARTSAGKTNFRTFTEPNASPTRAIARATASPYRRRRIKPFEKISRTATGSGVSLGLASASNAAAAARAVFAETPGRKHANTRASRMDAA